MKKLTSILTVLLLAVVFIPGAQAADGDLFVQVDNGNTSENNDECSILKVEPDGSLSQFISPAEIEAVTGLGSNSCENTGLAVDMAGNVFFSLDHLSATDPDVGSILMATPDGTLSQFASPAQLLAAIQGAAEIDLENGMAFGPDGALYVNDSDSNSILRIPVPLGPITQVVTENQIEALLGPGANIDLDSGLSVDQFGNIYFANDDSTNDLNNVIFKYSPVSGLSILTTQQQLIAATGVTQHDLDVGMVLKGILYVMDDEECDCVLVVNPVSGQANVFVTEDQITDATGESGADLEGGIAADKRNNLYLGEDGGGDQPNIVLVKNGRTSIFVSDSEVEDFYDSLGIGFNPEFQGSMAIEGVKESVAQIPTLSEWGLIAMALALGMVGFVVMRKRALKA